MQLNSGKKMKNKTVTWNEIEFPAKVDIIDVFGTHRDGKINISSTDICGANTVRVNGILYKEVIGDIKFFMLDFFVYSYAEDCTIIFTDYGKVIEGMRFFCDGKSEQPVDYYSLESKE